jgi:hypothetical protein
MPAHRESPWAAAAPIFVVLLVVVLLGVFGRGPSDTPPKDSKEQTTATPQIKPIDLSRYSQSAPSTNAVPTAIAGNKSADSSRAKTQDLNDRANPAGALAGPSIPSGDAKATDKPSEKAYSFAFDNKPWDDVIYWFVSTPQVTFECSHIPPGTFTFSPPKGTKLTIAEIVDAINDALQADPPEHRYVLIRGNHTFAFALAGKPIEDDLVRKVAVGKLSRLGRTEIVRIDVPLQRAVAEELAPKLKTTMSQFGSVVVDEDANQLVLIDNVENLKNAVKSIAVLDDYGEDRPRAITSRQEAPKPMKAGTSQKEEQTKTTSAQAPALRPSGRSNNLDPAVEPQLSEPAPAPALLVKSYSFPDGDADEVAAVLKAAYKDTPSVRVVTVGIREVMVTASAADHARISQAISKAVNLQETALRDGTARTGSVSWSPAGIQEQNGWSYETRIPRNTRKGYYEPPVIPYPAPKPVHVSPYFKKDGTFVPEHFRALPHKYDVPSMSR